MRSIPNGLGPSFQVTFFTNIQYYKCIEVTRCYAVLFNNFSTGKPLLPAGNILEREHLWHIHEAIFDVRSQWKNIGRALGVESSHLDSIHGNTSPHDDKGECLYQVLERWIRSGEATVTMNRLLEVLEGKVIGEKHLVNEIRAYKPEQKTKIGLD